MHFPRRSLTLILLLLFVVLMGFLSLRLLRASVTPPPTPADFIRSHLNLTNEQCPTSTHKIQFWADLTLARLTYDPAFDVFTGAGEGPVINVSDAIALNSAMALIMVTCDGTSPPIAECGNGTEEGEEVCDDDDTLDGDFCSADCQCDHREHLLALADANEDTVLSESEMDALLTMLESWLQADAPDPDTLTDSNCDQVIDDADVLLLIDLISLLPS